MCKFNPRNYGRRIDPCLRKLIKNLDLFLNDNFKVVACCCGHGKYPMSIIIVAKELNIPLEIISGKNISRRKKFYKKDKQGYYFIPETIK